jgi:hypothetical protein
VKTLLFLLALAALSYAVYLGNQHGHHFTSQPQRTELNMSAKLIGYRDRLNDSLSLQGACERMLAECQDGARYTGYRP